MSSRTARAPVAPATLVAGVLIAFCALLLLKWLAVVALAALALAGLVRWARRATAPLTIPAQPTSARDGEPDDEPGPEDCSWCGLAGGHRDLRGRLLRPRHVHHVR